MSYPQFRSFDVSTNLSTCTRWFISLCGSLALLLVRLDDGDEPPGMLSQLTYLTYVGGFTTTLLVALGRYRIFALTNNFTAICSSDATRTSGAAGQPPPGFSLEEEMRFLGWEQGLTPPSLRNLFDDFCDSSVFGMRRVFFSFKTTTIESSLVFSSSHQKFSCPYSTHTPLRRFPKSKTVFLDNRKPEPEFYLAACRRNGVRPEECVFLDDLGQ